MSQRYSIWALARNALTHHENWHKAWRSQEPKPAYDAIIIGGGGHGLATAYYQAKLHGMTQYRRAGARLDRWAATRAATPPSSAPTICWMSNAPVL